MFSRLLSENLKIKIYKTIVLPFVSYVCETLSLIRKTEGVWEQGTEEFYRRGIKWREIGEDTLMRICITCTLHQMLLR